MSVSECARIWEQRMRNSGMSVTGVNMRGHCVKSSSGCDGIKISVCL